MNIESIKSKNKKRLGRGISAGQGKTAGRGTKGQKSRAGHNIPKRFEGGQTPLSMRLPKLPGFKSTRSKNFLVSLDLISANFKSKETVSLQSLKDKGLVDNKVKVVKILNNGSLTKKVVFAPEIKLSKAIMPLLDSIKEEVKKEVKRETPTSK